MHHPQPEKGGEKIRESEDIEKINMTCIGRGGGAPGLLNTP